VVSKEASAIGVKRVEIRNTSGSVEIRGLRTTRPMIKITATKWARARGTKAAREAVKQIDLKVFARGTRSVIVIRHPESSSKVKYGADLRILMPVEMDVDADNSRGKIRVLGLQGKVTARTVQGAIELRGVHGPVSATTKKGTITASGDLPSFELATSAGDVRIRLRDHPTLKRPSSATTGRGDIRLSLPKGFSAKLAARTKKGRIVTPIEGLRREGNAVTGRLGQGGPLLNLATGKGSITLIPRPVRRSQRKIKLPPPRRGHGHPHHDLPMKPPETLPRLPPKPYGMKPRPAPTN
jgi:hypothetical protein